MKPTNEPGASPPASPASPTPGLALISLRCTYCRDALAALAAGFCGGCLAPHHEECFGSHQRCSAPGCGGTSLVAPRRPARPRAGSMRRRQVAIALLLVASNVWTFLLARPPEPAPRSQETQETRRLRAALDEATQRREIAFGQVVRLTHLKTALEKDLGDLRCAYADSRKALKERELVDAMRDNCDSIDIESHIAGPPMPAIDARVAGVKSDVSPALVLLSAGSDDKVEKGFHFSVYRGSEFIGKVLVEKVLKDSCGCRVLFTKDGASILAGDTAATRLE